MSILCRGTWEDPFTHARVGQINHFFSVTINSKNTKDTRR